MNPATETLLRRAVSQAVTLTRQNTRCVFTDKRHGSPSPADGSAASLSSMALGDHVKTIMDLPGPEGYPIVGSALEYFRKPNRGQMHEVQVSFFYTFLVVFRLLLLLVSSIFWEVCSVTGVAIFVFLMLWFSVLARVTFGNQCRFAIAFNYLCTKEQRFFTRKNKNKQTKNTVSVGHYV